MKQLTDGLCYISEQTSFPEDYENFGYTVREGSNGFPIVDFESILQSFGVLNRNGRNYQQDNVWTMVQTDPYVTDQRKRNCWQGEEDHPSPMIDGQKLPITRLTATDLGRASHYIRNPRCEGNKLRAHIQTDNGTECGRNMAVKIIDGKIVPGFSARVFGNMTNVEGKPTIILTRLITYDWVNYPSHSDALAELNQPLMESANQTKHFQETFGGTLVTFDELREMLRSNSDEMKLLCESFHIDESNIIGMCGDSAVVQENANIFVQPLTDKRILSKSKNMISEWLHS